MITLTFPSGSVVEPFSFSPTLQDSCLRVQASKEVSPSFRLVYKEWFISGILGGWWAALGEIENKAIKESSCRSRLLEGRGGLTNLFLSGLDTWKET